MLFVSLLTEFEEIEEILTLPNFHFLDILKTININKEFRFKIINFSYFDKLKLKYSQFGEFNEKMIKIINLKIKNVGGMLKSICFSATRRLVLKISSKGVVRNQLLEKFASLLKYENTSSGFPRNKIRSNMVEDKDKLLVITESYMIFRLELIIKELSKDFVIYLLEKNDQGTSGSYFANKYKNIKVIHLKSYMGSKIARNTQNARKFLSELFTRQENSGKFENVFKYDEISYWNLIRNDVRRIYSESFIEIFKNYQITMKIINLMKPNCLLTMNDVLSFEKTIINAAKNSNILTLVSQHGLIQKPKPPYPPVYVDKFLLWGKLCGNTLKRVGCDEKKFVLIGNPSYDSWYIDVNSKTKKARIYRDLKISKDYKIILCSISPKSHVRADSFRHDNITPIVELLKIITEDNDLYLIIKLHPGESSERYEKLVKKYQVRNCKVLSKYNVKDLLKISDLLVMVTTSTIGLEAFLFNVFVIYANFTGLKDDFPLSEYNAGIVVQEPKNLKNAIYEVLNNEDLRNELRKGMKIFIEEALFKFDGKAALRTANYLKKVLQN